MINLLFAKFVHSHHLSCPECSIVRICITLHFLLTPAPMNTSYLDYCLSNNYLPAFCPAMFM